jgi:hypothetical protein
MWGHVARTGKRRGAYGVLVGKPEGKRPLSDPGLNGMIILKRIFRKWDWEAQTGLIWLRIRAGDSTCECGNELSGSIECGEFLH